MFVWTPEMIRFLEDASRRTDYYAQLADAIAGALPAGAQVCDFGCGLGQLAEALCARGLSVSAVERDAQAVGAFRSRLGAAAPPGLEILCVDAFSLPPTRRWDAAVFCYFGRLQEVLALARRHCAGPVFYVRRSELRHRFDLGGSLRESESVAQNLQALSALGLACTCTELEAEFGQPLRSLEDALRFFRLYRRDPSQTIDPAAVRSRLVDTGDAEFPLYFPQKKRVTILQLDARQLR